MNGPTDVLIALAAIAVGNDDRATRAKEAAEQIRRARGFHWVGLYDVMPSAISAIAWTGTAAPAFPRTQGLVVLRAAKRGDPVRRDAATATVAA